MKWLFRNIDLLREELRKRMLKARRRRLQDAREAQIRRAEVRRKANGGPNEKD